jgi:hypothetical protein
MVVEHSKIEKAGGSFGSRFWGRKIQERRQGRRTKEGRWRIVAGGKKRREADEQVRV